MSPWYPFKNKKEALLFALDSALEREIQAHEDLTVSAPEQRAKIAVVKKLIANIQSSKIV